MTNPLFELGRLGCTPGAKAAIPNALALILLSKRHASGDWGCVDPDDARANALALENGARILSAYPIDPAKPCEGFGDNCLWIITEADRSATTILLPEEY